MSATTRSDRNRYLRRVTAAAAAAGLIVALALTPVVGAEPDNQAVAIAAADGPAQSWLVADMVNGQILAGRNPYGLYAPASTIKALLALVVLDELNPDAVVRATPSSTDVECSCVGLVPGAVYPIRALLTALMMVSGNDAANLLAESLGGNPVAIAKMNAKAAQLGASNTRAGSPSGLDGPGWESVTTAQDLAIIYRAALTYPLFAQSLHQSVAQFPDGAGGVRTIASRDQLLPSYPGYIGGKTGYTNLAKETYVGMAQRDGHRVIVVAMYGADELWDQGRALLDWGFSQYGR